MHTTIIDNKDGNIDHFEELTSITPYQNNIDFKEQKRICKSEMKYICFAKSFSLYLVQYCCLLETLGTCMVKDQAKIPTQSRPTR